MTMLKGYAVPLPGSGDGEYGSFGSCSDCGLNGYDDSPATRPYWANQRIARTIQPLNGYGDQAEVIEESAPTQNLGPINLAPRKAAVKLGAISLGAIIGYALGRNPIAATVGAGIAYVATKAPAALNGFDLNATIKSTVNLPVQVSRLYADSLGPPEAPRAPPAPPAMVPVSTPPPGLQVDPSGPNSWPAMMAAETSGLSTQTMLLIGLGAAVAWKALKK